MGGGRLDNDIDGFQRKSRWNLLPNDVFVIEDDERPCGGKPFLLSRLLSTNFQLIDSHLTDFHLIGSAFSRPALSSQA
jgi:hypothetical protein